MRGLNNYNIESLNINKLIKFSTRSSFYNSQISTFCQTYIHILFIIWCTDWLKNSWTVAALGSLLTNNFIFLTLKFLNGSSDYTFIAVSPKGYDSSFTLSKTRIAISFSILSTNRCEISITFTLFFNSFSLLNSLPLQILQTSNTLSH